MMQHNQCNDYYLHHRHKRLLQIWQNRVCLGVLNIINWDNQPDIDTENQIILAGSNIYDQDYIDIDVTDLVISMIINPDNSFGL